MSVAAEDRSAASGGARVGRQTAGSAERGATLSGMSSEYPMRPDPVPVTAPADRRANGREHSWAGSSCAYLGFEVVNHFANIVHILSMCDAMTTLGIDAELIAYPEGGSPPVARDLQARFGLVNEPNVTWITLNPNRWFARARLVLESYRAARRHDFVYTRSSLAALGALMGGARRAILEVHQPDHSRHGRVAFALVRHSRRLHVVCISRRLAGLIAEEYRLHEADLIVEHTGTTFPIRYDYVAGSAPDKRLVATYVGTYAPGRGIETIFAMAERTPDVDFVVVGGPENVALEPPACGIPSNVHVTGRVPHGDVQPLLAQADVLLLSYTTNVWRVHGEQGTGGFGSPLKMFEYLAAGRAIIASSLPSISEVLVDGSNALLADESSDDEWVDALNRLAADPDLRVRLARAATQTAEYHTMERRLCRVLDQVWSRG